MSFLLPGVDLYGLYLFLFFKNAQIWIFLMA